MAFRKYDVVGVYIERSRALLCFATATRLHLHSIWKLKPREKKEVSWQPNDAAEAVSKLKALGTLIGQRYQTTDHVAVAGYGPFRSLARESERCGELHDTAAHPPLRGANLKSLFQNAILSANPNHVIEPSIFTDAQAGAVGEAISLDLPNNRLLAYFIVGEGVGLGLTVGRKPLASALHPEIGLINLRIDPKDPLQPPQRDFPFSLSLAELASHDAMLNRLNEMHGRGGATLEMLKSEKGRKFWDYRAYYLAQASLACSALLPPHKISIAAYIDPMDDIGARTMRKFSAFLRQRKKADQPLFEYPELAKKDFIASALRPDHTPPGSYIAQRGAIGACYLAADSIGARDVDNIGSFRRNG